MYAVIGRVKIKPDHADETRLMIGERGVAMLKGMDGSIEGYWAPTVDSGDIIQHSVWLFDTEENARSAEATFNTLRGCPTHQRSSSASTCARSSARLGRSLAVAAPRRPGGKD